MELCYPHLEMKVELKLKHHISSFGDKLFEDHYLTTALRVRSLDFIHQLILSLINFLKDRKKKAQVV